MYGSYIADGTRTVHLRVGDGLAPTTEFVDSTCPAVTTGGISTHWNMKVLLICTAIGSSATVEGQWEAIWDETVKTGVNTSTLSFDATTNRTIALTADWSAATAGNFFVIRQFLVELVN